MKRLALLTFALATGLALTGWVVMAMSSAAVAGPGEQAEVWLTTGNETHKLVSETVVFNAGSGSHAMKITVTDDMPPGQHPIEGFGAALTDSAAWLIAHTPEPTRTQIMQELFSPTEGIGITYLRIPMGASDFVTGTEHYTYDDLPLGVTDTQLISFSVAHDQAYIIPLLQEARQINPKLKVMASPWSAPAWMKSPETLYGGVLKTEYHQAYANYFVEFIQAYAAAGIPIHAITVQNEPWFPATAADTTDYPAMRMEPAQQAYFVKEYLGPAFTANNIQTKIIAWDHNWDGWQYPKAVLEDPQAYDYIAGTAWHCYCSHPPDCQGNTPEKQSNIHNLFPEKEIYFTECSGSLGSDFSDDLEWDLHTLFIDSVRNWAQTVLLFNLVLDPNGGPHLGGCTNCRGVLTIAEQANWAVTKNIEYHAIGHLSKFVDPGAYRIESTYITGTLESVAFRNPDHSTVLVVLNPGDTAQSFDVQWHGRHISYFLEAQSVATFKWNLYDIYLPLAVRNYHAPQSFQNFEPGNGTPGTYFGEKWNVTCLFDTSFVQQGQQSLGCHASAQSNGQGNGGTVIIYPSSSDPLDLSTGETFSAWVYDTQGANDIEMKLCDDQQMCSGGIWSKNRAVKNTWTQLTWELSQFTAVDKTQVRYIELYEWNDGVYYFDDITWK